MQNTKGSTSHTVIGYWYTAAGWGFLSFLEARNGEGTKDILNLKQWAQDISNISYLKKTLQISLIYSLLKIFQGNNKYIYAVRQTWNWMGQNSREYYYKKMEPLNQSFIITLHAEDFSLKTLLGLKCSNSPPPTKLTVCSLVHRCLPLVPILIQMNQIPTFQFYLRSIVILTFMNPCIVIQLWK